MQSMVTVFAILMLRLVMSSILYMYISFLFFVLPFLFGE